MWVVKIGGSLQDSDCLTDWLNRLIEHGAGKVVIVPGGGKFADAVRQAQRRDGFDDVKAHKMALRAMEQYARLLVSIAPELEPVSDLEGIYASLENKKIVLWMPYELIEKNQELPASWAVTSDALSVWLALELNFRTLFRAERFGGTRINRPIFHRNSG
jgi:aspartokinase-like uncharacterized kinase